MAKTWGRFPVLLAAAALLGMAAQSRKVEAAAELSTRNVKKEESNLANLIADAVRSAAGADAAFLSASAFTETTIPKGSTTAEEILKALAFRHDSISVVRLKGEQVKAALEHGLALYPQQHSAFLQVSGITVTIDPKADKDRRVTSVKIGGSEIDPRKVYLVAMPAPLADGALAFHKIWARSDIDSEKDPRSTLEDAVLKYLAGRNRVGEESEERLVFKK